jgi:hypothetical protein
VAAVAFPRLGAIAGGVHRLGQQAEVAAYRDAALGEEAHRFHHDRAAFQLDHVGAGGHEPGSGIEGLFRVFLIAAEGQIGHHEGLARRAAGHGLGVIGHLLQRDRQGGGMPLDGHAQGVAHQQTVHAVFGQDAGEAGVVAGEDGEFFALFGAGQELGKKHAVFSAGLGILQAPRLKNSRAPRMSWMRWTSNSKSASLSAKFRCSLLTVSSGALS